MKRPPKTRILLAAFCAAASAAAAGANPFFDLSESEQATAVSSRAYNGYVRARKADGGYATETYAFGNGGELGYYIMRDPTFDNVTFPSIIRMLAGPLARRNYLSSQDPNATNLFIMVYWGTTTGASNVKNGYLQDSLNYANARLLGFDTEPPFEGMRDPMSDAAEYFWGPTYWQHFLMREHGATMSEISINRYYVIMRAFDFQSAWKKKKLKLLWETRFSLSQRLHDFGRDLPLMAQSASAYFGRDSYGLVRRPVPEGRVKVGEPTVVDDLASSGDLSQIAGDWRGGSPSFPLVLIHVDRGGNSTLEYPRQNWTAPAGVTVAGNTVTVRVPGWGLSFDGKIRGRKITGTLAQYGHGGSLTLTRDSE
jgi:hypothetical protein